MHAPQDSMWQKIWNILQFFLGIKQGLKVRPGLVSRNFQNFPSDRIFGQMYEALNIDKK